MKPFVFALFLAAPFFAFAGSSHKSISAQISVLDENMPSEFAIGQAVEAEFYFDEQAESSVFFGYQYSNLITDFSLSVAGAGFHFESAAPPASLSYNPADGMFSMDVDGGGFEFAGMRFVNISFAFEGDVADGGNPLDYFASAQLDYFSFSFYDPAESQMVSGCLMENSSGAPINFTVDFSMAGGDLDFADISSISKFLSGIDMEAEHFVYDGNKLVSDGGMTFVNNGGYWMVSIPEPAECALMLGFACSAAALFVRAKRAGRFPFGGRRR